VFALIGGILIYRSFAASNPNLPGDVNNDNVVDITDLSTILTYFNTTDARGDADNSGRVDITDLSIVLSHYGSRYTPIATTISQTIANNSTLSGTITWLATTSNDSDVNSVDFYLDGVFRNTEASAPYASSDPPQTDEGLVDTTKLSNGSHTFKAVANLKDGTKATNSVTATVNNSVVATTCTKYASKTGSDSGAGTLTSPYQTPQKLVDNLSPGQTGCLRQGTYDSELNTAGASLTFLRGGTSDTQRITLTSYPNERATIISYIPASSNYGEILLIHEGANFVTVSNINIVAPLINVSGAKLAGDNMIISGLDVTANYVGGNCLYFGDGTAPVNNVKVYGNRLHECGNAANDNKDHCIYAHTIHTGEFKNNILYNCAAYAIQFYTDSQSAVFDHNTIDGGTTVRGGIVFGSDPNATSNNNTVTNNVVTYSAGGSLGITASWGGAVGAGNVANNNCLYQAIVSPNGFSASGNITASTDPFNNRSAHDYTVKPASVCAGKGA
ncbi:hypothetical protein KW803_03395, partial [Candidatus Saccharibacteria bacterium]|nr:hypothetical protein [Candidatus Saccharibacteria bacterium]